MPKKFITIQDASEISNKSIQTIRRAIKAKKFAVRKKKTPQGFNYLIDSESLCKFYNIKSEDIAKKEEPKVKNKKSKKSKEIAKKEDVTTVKKSDFQTLAKSLEKMVSQHSEERQNFIRLIGTLQEKVFVLENQINLLKAPQKRWYQLWKK